MITLFNILNLISIKLFVQKVINCYRVAKTHSSDFFCPICNKKVIGYFGFYKNNTFLKCSNCESLSRQRLVVYWLLNEYKIYKYKSDLRILHFAAEKSISCIFINYLNYSTADLMKKADLKINIENTRLLENSYDLIIANHVLEHVNDDFAIKELSRIISKNGVILITVPIIYSWELTYENNNLQTMSDKELYYGQTDHLRLYGRDITKKFIKYGLNCNEFMMDGTNSVKFGIDKGEILFILSKI